MIVRCYAEFSSSLSKERVWNREYGVEGMAGRQLAEIVTGYLIGVGCEMEDPAEEPEHGWQGYGLCRGRKIFFQVNESFSDDDQWTLMLTPRGLGYRLFGRMPAAHAELLTEFANALAKEPCIWNVRWFVRDDSKRGAGALEPVTN